MARRRSRARYSYSDDPNYRPAANYQGKRKSDAEARVERFTWFLLVAIFAALTMLPVGTIPNAFVPFSGAVVLLGSGTYQYTKRWKVSPITWIAGSIMLVFGLYNLFLDSSRDLLGLSLVMFAVVIGFGVLTGET